MKRFLLFVLVVAVAAALAFYLVRRSSARRAAEASRLLPADTLAFFHVTDLEASTRDWQGTDLRGLLHEPAVDEFLRQTKWATRVPAGLSETAEIGSDLRTLRVRNAFIAADSVEELRVTGGLEFRCSAEAARVIADRWRSRLLAHFAGAQRSTIVRGERQVEVVRTPSFSIASTFAGDRLLVATKLDDLDELLDRIDGKVKTATLASNANFRAALKQVPGNYAGLAYLEPKLIAEKLVDRTPDAHSRARFGILETVPALVQAWSFEGGKIREVGFAAVPETVKGNGKVAQHTLSIASADTLLYIDGLVDLPDKLDGRGSSGTVASLRGKWANTLAGAKVSPKDLRIAFGEEKSLLLEWPRGARVPDALATVQVRDAERARKIVAAVASASSWSASAHGNTIHYHLPLTSLPLGVNPTLAVTDRLLLCGVDTDIVDRGLGEAGAKSALVASPAFRERLRQLAEPQQMFGYFDWGMAYQRFDTMLRPLLQMGTTLAPRTLGRFDPGKLPPAEVVVRHLGPTLVTVAHTGDGYRWESTGSIPCAGLAGALGLSVALANVSAELRSPQSGGPALRPSSPAPSIAPATPARSP